MGIVNEALVQEGISQRPLPLIKISEWFDLLQALDPSTTNIKEVVSKNH